MQADFVIGKRGSSSKKAVKDNCGIEDDTGQMSTGVESVMHMSHNPLTNP